MVPSDFPRTRCAIGARAASVALRMLTVPEVAKRFGIGRQTALDLCRNFWPELGAIRVAGGPGPEGWHWRIDPAAFGLLLEDLGEGADGRTHYLDREAAARRFGVGSETFAGLHPGQLGVLFAMLPLPDRPRQPQRRPSPPPERAEVGHAAD
jgi:hypothetical protein